MVPLARKLTLFAALLVGLWIAGYYTYQLRKQELRDWRKVEVAFTDVGGLKHKSTVMLNGSPMGRVANVRLWKDRHLVTLELDPEVVLFNDMQVEVVPTSALGTVGLEINPHSGSFNENMLIVAGYERPDRERLLPLLDRVADGEYDLGLLLDAGYDKKRARQLRQQLKRVDHKNATAMQRRTGLPVEKVEELQRRERRATLEDIVKRTGWTPEEAERFMRLQDEPLPDPAPVLDGKVRSALAGAPPGPGRRKELNRYLRDIAQELEDIKNPESGPVGSLIFDSDRVGELDQALSDLEASWTDLDEGLARIENDASQTGFLSVESLEAATSTAQAFNETFAALKSGLKNALDGEGTTGAFLGDRDFAHGFRNIVRDQRETWRSARAGEGTLGTLVDAEAGSYTALNNVIDAWEKRADEGVRGEGTLGLLSNKQAGEDSATIIRNVAGGLDRLRQSALITNPEARDDVEDLFGDAEDLMGQLRRGLNGIRRGLPDRNFHGAVFSVF